MYRYLHRYGFKIGISASRAFNFARLEEWSKWIRKFERFRDASDLDGKSEQNQVSSLIYAMGEEAEDILQSFQLTEDEQKSYTMVRDNFQSFFCEEEKFSLRTV